MPPPSPAAPPATLPPELQHYFELLGGIENASKFLVIGPDDAVVHDAPVKDMIDFLVAYPNSAKALIFDGIVSQRLLDVAQEKNIGTIVASRLGPVGKMPENVRIFTRQDLGGAR
ncbi:TOPRIM domain protein [mine drainage metagenome]|uniref:TOPRIM domain protein n=1 Tax=mine drainage metagenome TaxID=410659 RepID=T1BT54_9ZZZZ